MKRKYGKDKSCGYLEHGSECLCDVKPIGVKIGVADLVNDMFMGRELCDVRNYCAPWTPNDILDYFTDLCTFYDAYAEQKKNPVIIGDFESQTLPEHVRHGEHGGRTQIRHYVRTVYDTYGRSMSDTLRQLGVSPDEYRYSLSVSRKSCSAVAVRGRHCILVFSFFSKLDRPGVIAHRPIVIAQPVARDTAVDIGVSVFGLELEDFFEAVERAFPVLLQAVCPAEHVVCFGEVGFQSNRFLKEGDALVVASFPVGFDRLGVEGHGISNVGH